MEIKNAFISQYMAAFNMLREAVNKADDELWLNKKFINPFWQIAYHALYCTDLYLSEGEENFIPWEKHKDEYDSMGTKSWKTNTKTDIIEPYRQDEIIEYLDKIANSIEERIAGTDLSALSEFDWLPFSNLELHIYNIRHLQHHTGQLIDRLRELTGSGIGWIRGGEPKN